MSEKCRRSKAANGKHMPNMCSHSVSLLGKSDVPACTKNLFLLTPLSNLMRVIQEKFGKI